MESNILKLTWNSLLFVWEIWLQLDPDIQETEIQ